MRPLSAGALSPRRQGRGRADASLRRHARSGGADRRRAVRRRVLAADGKLPEERRGRASRSLSAADIEPLERRPDRRRAHRLRDCCRLRSILIRASRGELDSSGRGAGRCQPRRAKRARLPRLRSSRIRLRSPPLPRCDIPAARGVVQRRAEIRLSRTCKRVCSRRFGRARRRTATASSLEDRVVTEANNATWLSRGQ